MMALLFTAFTGFGTTTSDLIENSTPDLSPDMSVMVVTSNAVATVPVFDLIYDSEAVTGTDYISTKCNTFYITQESVLTELIFEDSGGVTQYSRKPIDIQKHYAVQNHQTAYKRARDGLNQS